MWAGVPESIRGADRRGGVRRAVSGRLGLLVEADASADVPGLYDIAGRPRQLGVRTGEVLVVFFFFRVSDLLLRRCLRGRQARYLAVKIGGQVLTGVVEIPNVGHPVLDDFAVGVPDGSVRDS